MARGFVTASAATLLALGGREEARPSEIGLAPDPDALSQAEAVTSSVGGSDSLYYNPAGLARGRISLRLVGVEGVADRRLAAGDAPSTSSSAAADLEKGYELLASHQPAEAGATVRALDLAVPYVALQSFATTNLTA